jgi:hypothetical protein
MRLVLGWLVISIALIVGGGQMAHDAANNGSAPRTVSIHDVVKGKPEKTWLEITEGVLVLPAVTWMEDKNTKRIDELFVPVVSPDERIEGMRVHVLLRTRRPDLIARVREMRAAEKSDAAAEKFFLENMKQLFVREDVKGMVEWGIDSSSETRGAIAKISKNLAPNFMILRDGKEPQGSAGTALLVGGVVLLLGGGVFLFGGKIPRPGRSSDREVGSDFGRELGLENAPPVTARAKTRKMRRSPIAEDADAAPIALAVKAAPRKATAKVAAKTPSPAATRPPLTTKTGTKKVVKGAPGKPAAPEVKKAKPLLARKKRVLGS